MSDLACLGCGYPWPCTPEQHRTMRVWSPPVKVCPGWADGIRCELGDYERKHRARYCFTHHAWVVAHESGEAS